MAFLAGPRQVGKTTCAKGLKAYYPDFHYFNWDTSDHRSLIVQGPNRIAASSGLDHASTSKPLIVFDEIHKYRRWKNFLKGFFDVFEDQCRIMVTGSAKLNIYQRGGDSLMGRYFLYRMHPLSTREVVTTKFDSSECEIVPPHKIADDLFLQLITFGGFPEPFKKAEKRFSTNWHRLRKQQLIEEDIRALSQIQDLAELEHLMDIVVNEASQQLNVAGLANQLQSAESTIHRWIKTLTQFYYCYTIKPWYKNVRRAIRKMPKVYLWDWSMVQDAGRRLENFVASHLYKAVQFWTDYGLGEYELFYCRDKNKREVDFVVVKNKKPWFLVEVKASANNGMSEALHHFHRQLKTQHAFQIAFDMPYVDKNCFDYQDPVIVPASTFLSQLI